MRIPDSLAPLFDYGILDEVVRPLMSGKEAQVFVVVSGGQQCVAKVYKEAQNRTFKHRSEYTEGRKVRNSRDQRAMDKRSKHGRAQDEASWKSTEVDVIRRLHAAGVRVPEPRHFVDGVLIMDLVTDAEGNPAPRLADLGFTPEAARAIYQRLIQEVVRMLAAGIVHGDLSDFNVLVGADGPVIIDFPQSVDTAKNANARKLLLRDVDNLHRFLAQFDPSARRLPYAEEMWELFQQNALAPDTRLTGRFRRAHGPVNTAAVLGLVQDANYDERKRRDALGLRGGPPQQQQRQSQQPQRPSAPSQQQPRPPQPSQPQRPPQQPRQHQHHQPHQPHQPSQQPQHSQHSQHSQQQRPPHQQQQHRPPRAWPPRRDPAPGSAPPRPRQEPRPSQPQPQGRPSPNTGGGPPPNRSNDRSRRPAPQAGRRDEPRPIDVIVARRPPSR